MGWLSGDRLVYWSLKNNKVLPNTGKQTLFKATGTLIIHILVFCCFSSVWSVLFWLIFIAIIFQYDSTAYLFILFSLRLGRELRK